MLYVETEQMFHQIRVRYNDRDALRFLWREHMFDLIEDFQMNPTFSEKQTHQILDCKLDTPENRKRQ